MADPILSGLAGLTQGIFEGLKARKDANLQERAMAIKEKEQASKEAYYASKGKETAGIQDLRQTQIDNMKSQMGARSSNADVGVTKEVSDIDKQLDELTTQSARLTKNFEATSSDKNKKKYASQLEGVRVRLETLQGSKDRLMKRQGRGPQQEAQAGQQEAQAGPIGGGLSPEALQKVAPIVNALSKAASPQDVFAIIGNIDEHSMDQKTYKYIQGLAYQQATKTPSSVTAPDTTTEE